MEVKIEKTFWAKIYLSGPLNIIEQVCREECFEEGLCVTVDKTKFIYTGGEELGAVIGLINYPRFPKTQEEVENRAKKLGLRILDKVKQNSVLIMTSEKTEWISKREP
jgi:hypothetical protein